MTTTPFLGCKISLISKSEIRYEGILYTIDPKESTIALAKVRSYGTEERTAERQVPPREEIFEYIIFRAGDIKDLIVDDPPASIAPGLADPAIIQAHSTSTSSGATFPSSTFPQMTTNSSITSATTGQRTTGPAFQSSTSAVTSLVTTLGTNTENRYNKQSNSVESRSGNSTPTGVQQRVKSPQNDGSTQTNVIKQNPNRDRYERRGTGERGMHQNYNRNRGQQSYQSSNYNQSYQRYPQERRGSGQQQQQNYRQQNHNYSHPQQSVANRFASNYRESYSQNNRHYSNYNSGPRRPPMQSRPPPQRSSQNRTPVRPKDQIKFDGEFDFEKSEKEFKELEQKMTNLKMDSISTEKTNDENIQKNANESSNTSESTNGAQLEKEELGADVDHFYDKEKSFFDTISCEALERERGNVQRIDWKAERKLNSETFGVPLSYRRMGFRGRGYSNSRGYSGGYQNRNQRGGYGTAIRAGGGGDTRRYSGPQRNRN